MKHRVLISGFEPFGGEQQNPTALLIAAVESGKLDSLTNHELGTLDVRTVLLPVEFETAFRKLETEIELFRPSYVLAFGQAGGRSRIEFERFALNVMDADIPDNRGAQPRELPIVPESPLALSSTLPVRVFVENLLKNGIPAGLSNSAGLYVCNDLFYRMQSKLAGRSDVRSGFIHVPFLPEQALAKGAPSMELSQLVRALELVLEVILKIPFNHT